jgi:hypothetical protein
MMLRSSSPGYMHVEVWESLSTRILASHAYILIDTTRRGRRRTHANWFYSEGSFESVRRVVDGDSFSFGTAEQAPGETRCVF